jgi:DNA invertase Pin-like site-specific DNA recombinase
MLTVLGGLAEFERELIRSRTSEGRARARARGVVMGRKPKLTHHQRQEAPKTTAKKAKPRPTSERPPASRPRPDPGHCLNLRGSNAPFFLAS